MKKNRRYFLTGLFVLMGFLLFTLGCILFGGSELFTEKLYFETYFASSVQGLDVGAAVKFRGVQVGKVEAINFTSDLYHDDPAVVAAAPSRDVFKSMMYIRVLCSINLEQHPSYSEERLEQMVSRGMRATLGMQGITGIVFINLDYSREALASGHQLNYLWKPQEVYVPSTPTALQNIVDVVEDLGEELRKVNFSGSIDSITRLAETANTAVQEANLPHLSATFVQLGESLNKQVEALNKVIDALDAESFGDNVKSLTDNLATTSATFRDAVPRLTEQSEGTLKTVRETLEELKRTLSSVNETLTEVRQGVDFQEVGEEADQTLATLSRTAYALEALVDELREKPSRLIFDSPME